MGVGGAAVEVLPVASDGGGDGDVDGAEDAEQPVGLVGGELTPYEEAMAGLQRAVRRRRRR